MAGCHAEGAFPRVAYFRREAAFAITQEHGEIIVDAMGRNEINLAIAVDVALGKRVRQFTDGIERRDGGQGAIATAEEYENIAGAVTRHRNIDVAVGVEIGKDQVECAGECRADFLLEASIAIAAQQRHGVGIGAQGHEVELAVFIEIGGRDKLGGVRHIDELLLRQGSSADGEEEREAITPILRQGQIQQAIVVEIADSHGDGTEVGVQVRFGLEGSVPVAKKDRDGVRVVVRGDDIEVKIVIQIDRENIAGVAVFLADEGLPLEGAVAIAQEQGDLLAVAICGRQVDVAIAVEIRGYDSLREVACGKQRLVLEGAVAIANQD